MCIAGLPADLQRTISQILSPLIRVVSSFDKETARSTKLLFILEFINGAINLHRLFAIWLLARYSPKSQVWALCELDPSTDNTALIVPMSFEVVLSVRPSKVSQAGVVGDGCASAEPTLAAAGPLSSSPIPSPTRGDIDCERVEWQHRREALPQRCWGRGRPSGGPATN